ncbi:response regulator receiver modulated diguanylate cyclase/phosphodiesterase [Janthinobacterium sp. HH01]|uniref:EAL domain-containing protein n=1 Tax=Janthinobacterium sp. HH01 TaxID=1198452 RepID=UPI0002AE9364|nr:EAL domain-containing protein [Janthinobacterium sp. HH01]ELX11302.1 response regulator receiver modulated diguanylate cyclase/phosphodiesterase [Janthinobacterium sp. HH01]
MIPTTPLHSAKILIVDDQPLNLTVLEHLLASAGYTEVSATSDAPAVAALHRQHRYDLIVLDLNMPDMDGFQVLDSLRLIETEQYLPVLVMSAEPDYKLRALEAGARDFISKPCDYSELLSRIHNLLEVRLLYTGSRDYGRRMASHDSLTGLPNRQLFAVSLERQLTAAWPRASALLLIDLDGFTAVNDTLGHAAGDILLHQFAERLKALAPPQAVIGRLGNDEFALLLPALEQLPQASAMADEIRTALHQPFALPAGSTTLTVSIGIATCPGDADEVATLIRYADIALHQAKQEGRDHCCYFTSAMNQQAQSRYQLEHALRAACVNGEFELHYQPKAQISNGRIVGAEALLRWNRPGHGRVSPGEFIPLLERTGLIVQVGAWAIDEACRQIAAWAQLGNGPLPIAVNVASRQFADAKLEQTVAAAIARHGIDPGLLSLEVTESALMDDIGRTAATLAELRAMGVRIAIDDFGTGYSSLAYLKRFPVDTLKIDIAFIRDVTSSPDDAAVVDAIIAMAHSLKLDVVAEGVETASQLAYLGRHRCDQIQGYYFSRPLPAAHMEQLLRDETCLQLPAHAGNAPERTLLLIDDEPHVLTALQRLLRQDGYRVLAANGAAQAFQLLAEHPVQLILCDQRMEEMSGTDLLDKIKHMYPDTFRIILSGYTDLKTIMESINRGSLYRFYTKPWDNRTLRDNIRSAFRHYWQLHGLAESDGAAPAAATAAALSASGAC